MKEDRSARSLNIFNRARTLLFACIVVLLLCVGSLFFFSHQQEGTKSGTTQSQQVFGAFLSTPNPTLFSDNFSDNSQNWDVGTDTRGGSVINNGTLTLTNINHKQFREPLPSNTTYDDAAIAISVTLLEGDKNDNVGLSFRANGGQGYSMHVYGDDSYDITKTSIDAAQKIHVTYLAKAQHSTALHPKGQKNNIMVIMKGEDIVLLVNDVVAKSVRDNAFSSGNILLFVENGTSSSGVTASFDTIAVYEAPEHLPSHL